MSDTPKKHDDVTDKPEDKPEVKSEDKLEEKPEEASEEKSEKKKVWMPKKGGGFTSVMQKVKKLPPPEDDSEATYRREQYQNRKFGFAQKDDRRERDTRRNESRSFSTSQREPYGKSEDSTIDMELEAKPLPEIAALYTLGMQRSNPQRMMQVLADTEISVLIDVRSETAMYAPGFVKARDLAILLKESVNIEYRREEILLPTRESQMQYEQDRNWHRYTEKLLRQLNRRRVSEVFNRALFEKNKVVLLGEKKDHQQDIRGIIAAYLEEHWQITAVHHLQ